MDAFEAALEAGAQPHAGVVHGLPDSARRWAMLAHWSGLFGILFPLGGPLGPLAIYSAKRDTSSFVADQAREALNFQISALLAAVFTFGIILLLPPLLPLLGALVVAVVLLTVVGGVKARQGVEFRYPLTWRFVK